MQSREEKLQKRREYQREYRQKHLDELREYARNYQKAYYHKHLQESREYVKQRMRKYRQEKPEKLREMENRHKKAWFRKAKQELVNKMGGKCSKCGYSKSLAALDFHHKDSTKKERYVNRLMSLRAIRNGTIPIEAFKLLCSNCHRELHWEENNKVV